MRLYAAFQRLTHADGGASSDFKFLRVIFRGGKDKRECVTKTTATDTCFFFSQVRSGSSSAVERKHVIMCLFPRFFCPRYSCLITETPALPNNQTSQTEATVCVFALRVGRGPWGWQLWGGLGRGAGGTNGTGRKHPSHNSSLKKKKNSTSAGLWFRCQVSANIWSVAARGGSGGRWAPGRALGTHSGNEQQGEPR